MTTAKPQSAVMHKSHIIEIGGHNMTEEIQRLRRWSAEDLMGWRIANDPWWEPGKGNCSIQVYYEPGTNVRHGVITTWKPDDPTTGQIWMVETKMRKLGWYLTYKASLPNEFGNYARF